MQFYIIDQKPKGSESSERYRTDFWYDDSVAKGNAPKCPKCGAFIGLLEKLPPYRVHLETWGEEFGDLAFWMDSFLLSRRFREEFQNSGLKGLSSFERVEVLSHKRYGNARGKPPEYFWVLPQIGAARIDVEASGVEWGENKRPTCELCLSGGGVLRRWRRVVVDKKSWNGDDVFYAFGIPGELLTSARFFEWAKSRYFRNLIMKPAIECSHDFYPWEKNA
jgi:hypothetical protein